MTLFLRGLGFSNYYIIKIFNLVGDAAIALTEEIFSRQIPKEKAEYGLYGHFYTYPGYDFSEKANYHCGAWDLPYKHYNQGAHKP